MVNSYAYDLKKSESLLESLCNNNTTTTNNDDNNNRNFYHVDFE